MADVVSLETATRLAQDALRVVGIDNPRGEARLLLSYATGLCRVGLVVDPDRPLGHEEERLYAELVARRVAREPMAQIVGRREFWSLPFAVTRDTLDPRPDSETVIEASLGLAESTVAPRRVLDLGTGTGCLLLALLSEWTGATGIGIDIDPRAAAVAAQNAATLGLSGRAGFVAGDWASALIDRFDLVVSNPPYIARGEIDRLEPEVACFEPRRALDGGVDGLAAYRQLIPTLPRLLEPGGSVVLEVGAGQASAVEELLREAGFAFCEHYPDLSGTLRCVSGQVRQN